MSGGRVHADDHYTLAAGDEREMFVFAHGVATEDGFLHTTSQYGDVRTRDLSDGSVRTRANGLRRPVGLAVRGDGVLVVAEAGACRGVAIDVDDVVTVLAEGMASPVDVAFDGEQGYVSDEERGAVLRLDDGSTTARRSRKGCRLRRASRSATAGARRGDRQTTAAGHQPRDGRDQGRGG